MIELVFAMMMISNGSVIEYVPMGEGVDGMKSCLEQKRVRDDPDSKGNGSARYHVSII